MEQTIESIVIYSSAILLCVIVVFIYLHKKNKKSRIVEEKVRKAKEEGLHEPISLHPYVDVNKCIQTGACISACPEKDILGIIKGKATLINASQCIGHGACFQACPTGAISLRIGTEKRGIDLPHKDHHQNKFGQTCNQCHNEETFEVVKGARGFDHNKTDYRLEDKHLTVNCKASEFHHNKTAFKLDGKHINVPCAKCHKPQQEGSNFYIKYKLKVFTCESCHS